MMKHDFIIYQFSRVKIEKGDFTHFLDLYDPRKLPTGQSLKSKMGRIIFCIEGYDADPREIYLIPDIRRFYRTFHQAWAYWLYFCDLNQDGLRAMVFCCLDSLAEIKRDGQAICGVESKPLELVHFIARDSPHMNWMCERAGISEQGIFERTREVFTYFQLPFDVQ